MVNTTPSIQRREIRGIKVLKGVIDANSNNIKNVLDPVDNFDATNKQYVDNLRTVGDIKYSLRNYDHNGWLLCNGRSLLRYNFPILFDVIGTKFGSNSNYTFNLPNFLEDKNSGKIGNMFIFGDHC